MTLTSHDLGNDQTTVTGYEERGGLYVALTLNAAQWFKTEQQCVGWLARRGYGPRRGRDALPVARALAHPRVHARLR